MIGKVKPVNPPPLIKCVRYGLLILGIFYGYTRLAALRMYESKERIIRERIFHEKDILKRKEEKEMAIRDIIDLAEQFEVTEMPPGWDEDV